LQKAQILSVATAVPPFVIEQHDAAEFLNRMYSSTSSMSWELYKSERRIGKIIGESAYYARVSGKIGYEDTGIHEIALKLEQLQAELRQLIKAEITKVNIERRRNAER
jgi:hypothetical protein